ncbi:MAG: hypothetical protein ACRD7E_26210 [Bryobacteraceae bacterium]
MIQPQAPLVLPFVDRLYSDLLKRSLRYFFPRSHFEPAGEMDAMTTELSLLSGENGAMSIGWLSTRYVFSTGAPLTPNELRLLEGIGAVISARYRLLFNATLAATSFDMFRGLPEDLFVSAYLDPSPYKDLRVLERNPDRIASAIEVLRASSLATYENRRISAGVLLFGEEPDPCHPPPPVPQDAFPYNTGLLSIKSFYRIGDSLDTLALVDPGGLLVALADVSEWALPFYGQSLPAPMSVRYQAHCQATLCGGHICMVLTPNGEIKIFARGEQVFRYIGGRWLLTDASEKFEGWRKAIGDDDLSERLFASALNLAESRRGALFVVMDDPSLTGELVAPADLLNRGEPVQPDDPAIPDRNRIHYLLRGKRIMDLAPSLIETIANVDGAIVLDRESNLLAFGAILRSLAGPWTQTTVEGGRTTAALGASRYGNVLKVSEDGLVSFYSAGRRVWEM